MGTTQPTKKGTPKERRLVLAWKTLGLLGLVLIIGAGVQAGITTPERTVWGQVVAVNAEAAPPVIVAKAETGRHQELIVGATVGPETVITRGTHSVGLDTIRVGERVRLTYLKQPDGLVAKRIHVR